MVRGYLYLKLKNLSWWDSEPYETLETKIRSAECKAKALSTMLFLWASLC